MHHRAASANERLRSVSLATDRPNVSLSCNALRRRAIPKVSGTKSERRLAMKAPLTFDRYAGLGGTEVRSADGKKIGGVSALIGDREAREPEWIRVGTGFFGRHVVVPVEGATIDDDGIHVAFDKDVV